MKCAYNNFGSMVANNYVTFSYDANGNTIFDGLKNISLEYTQLNTLSKITTVNNTTQARYSFFADGAKYEVRDSLNNGRRYLGTFSQSITATTGTQNGYTLNTDEINSSSPILSYRFVEEDMMTDPANTLPNGGEIMNNRDITSIVPVWKVFDHLGSVRVVLDRNANILQQNDYYPFGLRTDSGRLYKNDRESNRLKFNGKEQQSGLTGLNLIDYGARFYDPTLIRWTTQDPLAEKYTSTTPYSYCVGNPINLIDIDGLKILFVNGYWNTTFIGKIIGSSLSKEGYWGIGFAKAAQIFLGDNSPINSTNYIDGSSIFGVDMSGGKRYKAGYQFAKDHIEELISGMEEGESFNMVTHSEGSAYGAGIAQYLLEAGYKVNIVLHLSADEGDEFSTPQTPYTLQLSYQNDWVTGNKIIQNVDKVGEIVRGDLKWNEVHGTTKGKFIFKAVNDLMSVRIQDNIGMFKGHARAWKSQQKGTTSNGTNFYSINGYKLKNDEGTKK